MYKRQAYDGLKEIRQPVELAKSELIKKGSRVAIMALGSMAVSYTHLDVYKRQRLRCMRAVLRQSKALRAI